MIPMPLRHLPCQKGDALKPLAFVKGKEGNQSRTAATRRGCDKEHKGQRKVEAENDNDQGVIGI